MMDTIKSFGLTVSLAGVFCALVLSITEDEKRRSAVRIVATIYMLLAFFIPFSSGAEFNLNLNTENGITASYSPLSQYERSIKNELERAVLEDFSIEVDAEVIIIVNDEQYIIQAILITLIDGSDELQNELSDFVRKMTGITPEIKSGR